MQLLTEKELGLEDFQCSTEVYDASGTCADSRESTELSLLEANQVVTLFSSTLCSIGVTHLDDSF